MRKLLTVFLLIGLFFCFPFCVSAKDTVYISGVEVEEVSPGTEEIEDATFNQLHLSFKISFTNVNDYIRYKVTIQNDTNHDYELNDSVDGFQNSENFLYHFEFDDNSKVIPAKSSKELMLSVSYMKELEASQFKDGDYVERNQMEINLSNHSAGENPKTGVPASFIIIVAIASIIGLSVAFNNRRYIQDKYGVMVLLLLLLPIVTYALETLTIHVDSQVKVTYIKEFCYYNDYDNTIDYFEFESGMIMNEYEPYLVIDYFKYHEGAISQAFLNEQLSLITNGEYDDFSSFENYNDFYEYIISFSESDQATLENLYSLYYSDETSVFRNNPILDKSVGCYHHGGK